jgi:hypothetical protein
MKNKRILKITFLGVFLLGLGAFSGYLFTLKKIDNDLNSLNKKIDILFDSNKTIIDGEKYIIKGWFTKDRMKFALSSPYGFIVYQLSKTSDGFLQVEYKSTCTLEYKYAESVGYNTIYRPSVQDCFDKAYELVLYGEDNSRKNTITENKLSEIKDFPTGDSSHYYSIKQTERPINKYGEDKNVKMVYTPYWSIDYYVTKKYFSIVKDEDKVFKSTLMNVSIFSFIALIIFFISTIFIIKGAKSKAGQSFINKRWKNVETNVIMLIEAKFFSKHSVTIIENEKVKRGIAKITEQNTMIQLSLADMELFYKVKNVTVQNLELENLVTNTIESFSILDI